MRGLLLLVVFLTSLQAFAQVPARPPEARCPTPGPDTLYSDAAKRAAVFVAVGTVRAVAKADQCRPTGFCKPFPIISLCVEDLLGHASALQSLSFEFQGPSGIESNAAYSPRLGERLLVTATRELHFEQWSCGRIVPCDGKPKEKYVAIELFRPLRESGEVGVVLIHGRGPQRQPSPTVSVSPCVLPEAPWVVADAPRPSPNTIEAVVLKSGEATIDVRVTIPDDRPLSLRLRTNSDTRLLSVSGEKLKPSDLKKGQHLFVWLEGCRFDPTLHSPLASVIHACPVEGCPQQGE